MSINISNFDAEFYVNRYPDLQKATIKLNLREKPMYLLKHYLDHGRYEKREYRLKNISKLNHSQKIDKTYDKVIDKNYDKVIDKNYGKVIDKNYDKAIDKNYGKAIGKNYDKVIDLDLTPAPILSPNEIKSAINWIQTHYQSSLSTKRGSYKR